MNNSGLDVVDAVLLGLIEGLTEWLPISSTGHLAVAQSLLGIRGDSATSYAIAIQAGAIFAVLGLYRQRFMSMVQGLRHRDAAGRHTLTALGLSCLPAIVVGLVFGDVIKARLFGPRPVIAAWLIGGIAILVFARRRSNPEKGAPLTALTHPQALVIGLAQVVALWPGTSRSLVTILAAQAVGLTLSAAVEYSFLLGFFILGGATAYEVLTSGGQMVEDFGVAVPLVGLGVAFLAAAVAMRWMVAYLASHGLGVFGWYRISAAVALSVLVATGRV